MSSTLQHQGSVRQARTVHIALASERGEKRLMGNLIEKHRADKIQRLRNRLNELTNDPEVGGLAVAAVISEKLAEIMKGYGK